MKNKSLLIFASMLAGTLFFIQPLEAAKKKRAAKKTTAQTTTKKKKSPAKAAEGLTLVEELTIVVQALDADDEARKSVEAQGMAYETDVPEQVKTRLAELRDDFGGRQAFVTKDVAPLVATINKRVVAAVKHDKEKKVELSSGGKPKAAALSTAAKNGTKKSKTSKKRSTKKSSGKKKKAKKS